jgi:hypothetical protein
VRQPFGHGIAGQLEQLARRQRFAEEQCRRLGQLVRFVEDHGVGGGQQFGHAGIAQHNVGKEQVMVDDHEVGLLRLLAGAHHEAFLVVRTFAAQAVVPRGGHCHTGAFSGTSASSALSPDVVVLANRLISRNQAASCFDASRPLACARSR